MLQVLQTASNLEEVTENVDYYVQGSTIAAGNLFGRCLSLSILGQHIIYFLVFLVAYHFISPLRNFIVI